MQIEWFARNFEASGIKREKLGFHYNFCSKSLPVLCLHLIKCSRARGSVLAAVNLGARMVHSYLKEWPMFRALYLKWISSCVLWDSAVPYILCCLNSILLSILLAPLVAVSEFLSNLKSILEVMNTVDVGRSLCLLHSKTEVCTRSWQLRWGLAIRLHCHLGHLTSVAQIGNI